MNIFTIVKTNCTCFKSWQLLIKTSANIFKRTVYLSTQADIRSRNYCTSSSTHSFGINRSKITGNNLRLNNNKIFNNNALLPSVSTSHIISRMLSQDNKKSLEDENPSKAESVLLAGDAPKVSMRDKMKRAVRDYGATIVVFHVTLALSHFGATYMAISSGLDLPFYLIKIGISEELVKTKVMTGASNGLVAYAIYKIFAPVRIAITLSVAPILVRYLRRKGILKPPKIVTSS